MSRKIAITRRHALTLSLLAASAAGVALAQNNTPYCNKHVLHTVGQWPLGHENCIPSGSDGAPCENVYECEVSDTCGNVPSGEGLQSCGNPTTVTTTCTTWTNGICKEGKCHRTEQSVQVIPGPPWNVTRYLSPNECAEN